MLIRLIRCELPSPDFRHETRPVKPMFDARKINPTRLPETVLAKWSAEILDEGFVPFPKRLLRCLVRLFGQAGSLAHLALILAVVDYKRPQLSRLPSADYLAFICGLSPKQFKENLTALKKKGWVSVHGDDSALDVNIDGAMEQILKLTAPDQSPRDRPT